MGAGLLRTRFMLGLILHPGVELPQSRRILVRTGLPQMLVQLGPVPPGARLSSDGAFSSQKEVAVSLMSSPAGPVPYRVHATVDNILTSAQLWMTTLMAGLTQIGTDSVTQDRDMPPVKAARAVTECRAWDGNCQAAGSHESRSTPTQPDVHRS